MSEDGGMFMATQAALPGIVNERELAEIHDALASETDDFANYITVKELSWIARVSPQRIYGALTYVKARRMTGIKRGPLWFIHRPEALRWAHEVAIWEQRRWGNNLARIERAMRRQGMMTSPLPSAQPRHGYQAPPEGMP